MIDFFFQMGLSNACLSLALGIVAMVVGAKARRPHLDYLLWLLVFVKLVTPPIVTIPVVTIPAQGETAVAINDHSTFGPLLSNSHQLNIDAQPGASLSSKLGSAVWNQARVWLPPIWLLGSMVVFAFSMVRICRFGRLLATKSEAAKQELQTIAVEIARQLGLNRIPTICTTSARISPMVWWAGGKVRIVIPTTLLDQMDAHQSQWILAHELAHVRRRDYLVRWLEWLACVVFWWNPVVWWAQRNLRATEEICCDDLVISCLKPKPKFYANSLLSAVEFLARPAFRPPAMASEINSGGFLERRFKMIISNKPNRSNCRWLQVCVLLFAVVVLPLGLAVAQDFNAVERRLGEGVAKGELTLKQAVVMIDALRKAGGAKKEAAKSKSDTNLESIWKKLQAMVKTGELTQEQANAKMSAIKKETVKKDQGADRAEAYLMKVKKELGAAVEAGRISEEDAVKRYKGAEKVISERMAAGRRGESKRITREDYARAEAELKKAVAEGKISEENARARLNEMRKMMSDQGGDKRADNEGFERRIKAAVEAGKMTREEAGERLEGYRRRMAMADQGDRGRSEDGTRGRIIRALMENGIAREQVEGVMGTLRPIVGEIQREGDAFELDPKVRESLAGMGLTDEQIGFVVMLAQRLASRPTDANRAR